MESSGQDTTLLSRRGLGQDNKMKETMIVEQYGSLPHDPDRYPLFAVKTRDWQPDKPHILVTGGVHGYETSGVQGALLFLQTKAQDYAKDFNIVVAPCVSPWAYERIQRWQADSEDPNRSFQRGKQTDESNAIMDYLDQLNVSQWTCHVDLHEITDTDAT
jgi:predicted deacylase